jgi:mannosyltransferase
VVPAVSRYAQEARGYAFATLFAVLATWLLISALEQSRWWRWLGYGLSVLLLGWSHQMALLLLTGHVVAVLVACRRTGRRRMLWWLGAVLVAGAGVLPLTLIGLGQRAAQLNWLSAAHPADLADLAGTVFGSGVAGGAICALAVFALRRPGVGNSTLWLSVLLPIGVLYAVDQLVAPVFVGRYLLFVVPLLCVLAGRGLADLRLPLGLAVVLLIGLIGLPAQQVFRRGHSPYDYRAVARLLAAGARAGDGIVYAPRDGWQFTDIAMQYYLGPAVPRDVLAQGTSSFWSAECADPGACLAGVDRIWVVRADIINTTDKAQPTAPVQRALGAYTRVTRTEVSGFSVTLMTRG